MDTGSKSFSSGELKKIDEADDLHIAPLRQDGKTYGTPTWIWEVVVKGDLYVRAYNGTGSRWYTSAVRERSGRITAAGMTLEVGFEPVQGDINDLVDEAYSKKYAASPYLSAMISPRARAATVKIVPR